METATDSNASHSSKYAQYSFFIRWYLSHPYILSIKFSFVPKWDSSFKPCTHTHAQTCLFTLPNSNYERSNKQHGWEKWHKWKSKKFSWFSFFSLALSMLLLDGFNFFLHRRKVCFVWHFFGVLVSNVYEPIVHIKVEIAEKTSVRDWKKGQLSQLFFSRSNKNNLLDVKIVGTIQRRR